MIDCIDLKKQAAGCKQTAKDIYVDFRSPYYRMSQFKKTKIFSNFIYIFLIYIVYSWWVYILQEENNDCVCDCLSLREQGITTTRNN